MKMTPVSSIYETFTHLITKLKENYPKLAYLHVTEPRVAGGGDQDSVESENLEWIVSSALILLAALQLGNARHFLYC